MIRRVAIEPFEPTPEQKATIDTLIDKWQPLLFLHEWRLSRAYSKWAADEPDCPAEITADCTYKRATLTFYPSFFGDREADNLEHIIVHELCHCVTMIMKEPAYQALVKEKHVMWHAFKEADERCTQQMTNIIFEIYRHRATL